MKTRDAYADSTIGMTAYNVLCMHSSTMNIDDIYAVAMQQHRHTMEQLQRCMAKLVELKRIRECSNGDYELCATQRLFVVKRDCRDFDEATMAGGWNGWWVKDPRIRDGQGMRPLEALIGMPLPSKILPVDEVTP